MRPRILLIDGNLHGSTGRGRALEQAEYFVEVACSGSEGVARYENGAFDLVVTAFLMSDLNGSEVIRRIRENTTGVPIVMLSGCASFSD